MSEKLRVLVVDDHERIIEAAPGWVARTGVAEVTDATSDPLEAVALYAQKRHDAVLCDVYMPQMNGFELTHALRQVDRDAVVVLMSAREAEHLREEAAQSGARAVVSKLARAHELRDVLLEQCSNIGERFDL